jgi:hypothetical protein
VTQRVGQVVRAAFQQFVGRTPSSAPDPLVRPRGISRAVGDQGSPSGPGGPPYQHVLSVKSGRVLTVAHFCYQRPMRRHHQVPIPSQMITFTTEMMKPIFHQSPCVTYPAPK